MNNKVIIEEKESVLFFDTDRRGNKEAMMDYGLAYTMKMCDTTYHKKQVNKSLLYSCRAILSKLIGEDTQDTENLRIQTYFEWDDIDLVVEVYRNSSFWHVIMIENKVDSSLKPHQLKQYLEVFKNHYGNEAGWKQHYYLIKAADTIPEYMKTLCDEYGVKYTTMDDLIKGQKEDTGNDIFDEFWLREWE